MATYKTAPLSDYHLSFQEVARRLFDLASSRLPPAHAVSEKGSYSFRPMNHSQETVVKILIFQQDLGRQMHGKMPWRDNGVYVLVRTNGQFGDLLWQESLPLHPSFAARMDCNDNNVGIAPNYDAKFAHFPIMAGESLDAIAEFIVSLVERAARA